MHKNKIEESMRLKKILCQQKQMLAPYIT